MDLIKSDPYVTPNTYIHHNKGNIYYRTNLQLSIYTHKYKRGKPTAHEAHFLAAVN